MAIGIACILLLDGDRLKRSQGGVRIKYVCLCLEQMSCLYCLDRPE